MEKNTPVNMGIISLTFNFEKLVSKKVTFK